MSGQAPQPPGEKSPDERRQALAQAVADTLAQSGKWRVESQSDYDAIVVKGKRTNHVLHLILSVVTMGSWLPVWLILVIVNREQKHQFHRIQSSYQRLLMHLRLHQPGHRSRRIE